MLRLRTQWRVGMNGAIGLSYETLPFWLEMEHVPREQWPVVTLQVQQLEAAMLTAMRDQRG